MDTHPTLPSELWDRTPPEIQAYMRALEARLAALEELETRPRSLQAQVRTLQEQLTPTSRHSSRPPSSDPPEAPRPKRRAGQRRRGGHRGQRGHTRSLSPVDEVTEVVTLCTGTSRVSTRPTVEVMADLFGVLMRGARSAGRKHSPPRWWPSRLSTRATQ